MSDLYELLLDSNYQYYPDEKLEAAYKRITNITSIVMFATVSLLFTSSWIAYFYGFAVPIFLTVLLMILFTFILSKGKKMVEHEIIHRSNIDLYNVIKSRKIKEAKQDIEQLKVKEKKNEYK